MLHFLCVFFCKVFEEKKMGNSQQVKSKFSSLELVSIHDSTKRFKFWSVYQGVLANDNQKNVSVFEFKLHHQHTRNNQDGNENSAKLESNEINFAIQCAKNALKTVKQYRHPSVIKYVDSLELQDGSFFLATEPVIPLRNVLHTMEYSEILLGFNQIATALKWLNEQCAITHNNIHLDSIYVSKDKQSRWVLGDFQFACPLKELTRQFLEQTKEMRYSETITPEEGMREFSVRSAQSRDVWAFGKCLINILNEHKEIMKKQLSTTATTTNIADNVKIDFERQFTFDSGARKWLETANESDPAQRATFDGFLKLSIFLKDPFCHTMLFFDDLRLKQTEQKEKFFRQLFPRIQRISATVLKKRVLPRMLTLPFVTEPAASSFLPHLFTPTDTNNHQSIVLQKNNNGLLSDEEYRVYMIPFLKKCFTSKNLSLRIRILQHLEYFMWYLDELTITQQVVPGTLNGLKDVNDDLVMFSMNALAQLTRYLSKLDKKSGTNHVGTVVTGVLHVLHHYAVSSASTMAIRSHALMSLIEMWDVPKVEKPVIFSALQHAIYDPDDYEIKLYALNVLLIHMHRFDPREYVNTILKCILPLTLHEKAEVRNKTIQVVTASIDYLQECDMSHWHLGMVSRHDQTLSKYTIPAVFPQSSKLPLERKAYFTGSAPSVHYHTGDDSELSDHSDRSPRPSRTLSPPPPSTAVVVNTAITSTTPITVQHHNNTVSDSPDADDFKDDDWGDKWDESDTTTPEQITQNDFETGPSASPFVSQSVTNEITFQSPVIPQQQQQQSTNLSLEKQVKMASKIEEDDDDSAQSSSIDYFSELGMSLDPTPPVTQKKKKKSVTKKTTARKSSVTTKQQQPVVTKQTLPTTPFDDDYDSGIMNTEIRYDDTGVEDVNASDWGDDDLDIGLSTISTVDNMMEFNNEQELVPTEDIPIVQTDNIIPGTETKKKKRRKKNE
jgi:hypothetical protein